MRPVHPLHRHKVERTKRLSRDRPSGVSYARGGDKLVWRRWIAMYWKHLSKHLLVNRILDSRGKIDERLIGLPSLIYLLVAKCLSDCLVYPRIYRIAARYMSISTRAIETPSESSSEKDMKFHRRGCICICRKRPTGMDFTNVVKEKILCLLFFVIMLFSLLTHTETHTTRQQ